MNAKFRLGTLVATPGALDALPREISTSLSIDDSNPFISRGKPSSSTPIAVDAVTAGTLLFLLLGIFAIGIVQQPFLKTISLLFQP